MERFRHTFALQKRIFPQNDLHLFLAYELKSEATHCLIFSKVTHSSPSPYTSFHFHFILHFLTTLTPSAKAVFQGDVTKIYK